MKISAAFPPVPATPEHIGLAEKLGYSTAWVYDTPALQLDCWYCRIERRPETAS